MLGVHGMLGASVIHAVPSEYRKPKVRRKPDLYGSCMDARRARRAAPTYPRDAPTRSGFPHNFSKNCPQDLKMG